eukprot:793413-Prorocentrum_minimum.AAC.1
MPLGGHQANQRAHFNEPSAFSILDNFQFRALASRYTTRIPKHGLQTQITAVLGAKRWSKAGCLRWMREGWGPVTGPGSGPAKSRCAPTNNSGNIIY